MGIQVSWPSDSTRDVWKISVPMLTIEWPLFLKVIESKNLSLDNNWQALLFCSTDGTWEARCGSHTAAGWSYLYVSSSLCQLGHMALPPETMCRRRRHSQGLNQPLVGMSDVFRVVLFLYCLCSHCWHMAQKKKERFTFWKLKHLCPHLCMFSLSVISQGKIVNSPKYMYPSVWALK